MHGRISQDMYVIDKNPHATATQPAAAIDLNSVKANRLLPQVTTGKLNGLYNTQNMPVVYARGGQTVLPNRRQGGTSNSGLARILFPNRMPYQVKP